MFALSMICCGCIRAKGKVKIVFKCNHTINQLSSKCMSRNPDSGTEEYFSWWIFYYTSKFDILLYSFQIIRKFCKVEYELMK